MRKLTIKAWNNQRVSIKTTVLSTFSVSSPYQLRTNSGCLDTERVRLIPRPPFSFKKC